MAGRAIGHNDRMELPAGVTALGASPPKLGRSAVGEAAVVAAATCSLVLAAGAGYVFCASIWPVSISTGYGAVFLDWPWVLAYLVLQAVWVAGPVILLVLGLVHLLRHARHRWRSAACWLVLLAAGAAVGFLVIHGYRLLFSAYPKAIAGEPLGPSRWAPGGPYWLALAAAAGELAVGAGLVALASDKRVRELTAAMLLAVVVAVGFTLWYRTTYNVWPGRGASGRVHWCGRNYQMAGPPVTLQQAQAQTRFPPLSAEGTYPPLALSPAALLAATYPAGQGPGTICATLVFLRTGPDSYLPYSLEGGF